MKLYWWVAAAAGLWTAPAILGQTTTAVTDSRTPPAVAAGIPSSAYALTNIDTVDPYTGSVNIHIPLYKVGGRGEAGYTVMLLMEQKWQAVTHTDVTGNYYLYAEPGSIDNAISYYLPTVVNYTPGVVFSRQSTDSSTGTFPCTAAGAAGTGYTYFYGDILTRATFIDETATEHELVDTQTNGQPIALSPQPNCATDPVNGGTDRGRVFRSTDGTDLVFVADSDVRDKIAEPSKSLEQVPVMLSGWLLFPDGRKFRVDNVQGSEARKAAAAVQTVTNPLGLATTLAKGDVQAGAVATDVSNAVNAASHPIEAAKDPLGTSLTVGNLLQDVKAAFTAPPPPPPPTPPPAPRTCGIVHCQ